MPKSERFIQIEQMLLTHPEGIRRSEIAKRLGVHKSTITRDIVIMSSYYPIIEEDDGRIWMDKKGYLTEVRLTMFELESLHLASRLFAKVMKFPFPHAVAALRKLAEAQGKVSPTLAERIRNTAEDIDTFSLFSEKDYSEYRNRIEELGLAITEKRPISVRHFSQNKDAEQNFRLFPITLEPSPEGRSVYLLAWDLGTNAMHFRILKIERISKLYLESPAPELMNSIPYSSLPNYFSKAWNIWTSKNSPICVVLRFSATVSRRVSETQWHNSQILEQLDSGELIWHGKIAEPKEMYPWIRGWGPDVEVLEPEWLREMHREDFRKGLEVYANG